MREGLVGGGDWTCLDDSMSTTSYYPYVLTEVSIYGNSTYGMRSRDL